MAFNMILQLDKIKGASQHKKDAIDILAWSWGEDNPADAMAMVQDSGPGKVSMQDVSFTKYVDSTSPEIYLACADGTDPIDKAVLTVLSRGDKPEFMKITFEKCQITSVQVGGSGDDDRLTENFTLSFGSVEWEVGKVSTGYDLVAAGKK